MRKPLGTFLLKMPVGQWKARISSRVTQSQLEHAINWRLSFDSIRPASDAVVEAMDEMELPDIYRQEAGTLRSACDGRKFEGRGDSLAASHAFKYFGQGQGVSLVPKGRSKRSPRPAPGLSRIPSTAETVSTSPANSKRGKPIPGRPRCIRPLRRSLWSFCSPCRDDPEEGRLHLFVTIGRTSTFAVAQLVASAIRKAFRPPAELPAASRHPTAPHLATASAKPGRQSQIASS